MRIAVPREEIHLNTSDTNHESEIKSGIWGFWSTLGFSVLILVLMLGLQYLALVLYGNLFAPEGKPRESLQWEGDLLSFSVFLSFPVCILLIAILARKSSGPGMSAYLGLRSRDWKTFLYWNAALLVLLTGIEWVTYWLKIPEMPEFMTRTYSSARSLPLYYAAIGLFAPLFEELFFRGFIYRGVKASSLGALGAILLPALVWAFLHQQYEPRWYYISMIFVIGVFMGWARYKTGSLLVPISMHAMNNFISLIETGAYLQKTSG